MNESHVDPEDGDNIFTKYISSVLPPEILYLILDLEERQTWHNLRLVNRAINSRVMHFFYKKYFSTYRTLFSFGDLVELLEISKRPIGEHINHLQLYPQLRRIQGLERIAQGSQVYPALLQEIMKNLPNISKISSDLPCNGSYSMVQLFLQAPIAAAAMAGRKLVTINLEAEHRSVKCWGPDSMCLPNDIREPMRPVLHDLRELRLSLRDIRDISAHKPSPVNYLLSETPSLEKLSLELRHSMLFKESNSIIASMASDVRYGREMRARNQVLPAMPDVWTDEGAWHIENHLELLPFPIDLACLRELKLTGMSLCTSVLQSVLETFLPQLTKLSLQDIRIVDGPILKIQAAAHPYYVHSDESPEWHGIFVRLAEISKDTAHKKLWFSLRQLTRVRQNVPQVIIYLLPAPPTRQANHQTTPKRLTHQYMEYETTMLDRVYGFESLAKSMATTEFGLYSRLREEEPVEYHELSGDT